MSTENIKEVVKEKYGQAALRVTSGGSACCGSESALTGCSDPITSNLHVYTKPRTPDNSWPALG